MLKRLYVHNYKCLVNFEINFDKDISLFLGKNGSGKSTVFEVLDKLIRLILAEEKAETVFSLYDYPRWLDTRDKNTRFELDIEIKKELYKYQLNLTSTRSRLRRGFNIKEESLYCMDELIFKSPQENENELITRSGLVGLAGLALNRTAHLFKKRLSLFVIAHINPYVMSSTISQSEIYINLDFSNYAEWFAYLNENNRRGVRTLENCLPNILIEFDSFKIEERGRDKLLMVEFKNQANDKEEFLPYYFEELSEGQKVLIALYTLIYCTPDNSLICIDEPENFLALPEIQPWFDALYDQCAERNLQVILISHHPKIINFLASDSGYWFSRENNLTRVQKIVPENESGLSIAELVEKGWIYE